MRLIALTRGMFASVDDADYERLSDFNWYAHRGKNTWYARTTIGPRAAKHNIYMHRMLLTAAQIDHADGDGLNNQRVNLRPCTASLNQANRLKSAGTSSSYRGVTWDKSRQRWMAQINVNGAHRMLIRTSDELLAAATYDIAARAFFGEFAYSNLGVV